MALSQRIVEQEAASDALYKELYPDVPDPLAAANDPPVDTAPASAVDTPLDTPGTPPAPPTEPTSPPVPAVTEATWERRYRVLQGKYNAEVPRLQAELKHALERVTTPPAKQEPLVTPDEVEQYGQPFIDMVQRAAAEKFGPERTQLEQTIAELRTKIDARVAREEQTSAAEFLTSLNALAPDWETVDEQDDWKLWLAEYDPAARTQRQTLMNDALAKQDAAYVADMIAKWKASKTPREAPPQSRLEALVQPDVSRAPPPAPVTSRAWTKADVELFYKKASRGEYTDAQVEAIEADIQAAIAGGRYKK